MADPLNLRNVNIRQLEGLNFASNNAENLIGSEDLKTLLNKKGAFSLDDQGKLVVINPRERRDNFLVRFFKSFNSEYAAHQRILDRLPALRRNTSFNVSLRSLLRRELAPEQNTDQVHKTMVALRLKAAFVATDGAVSTGQIKESSEKTKSLSVLVKNVAHDCLSRTDLGSAVLFEGKSISFSDFIRKNHPEAQLDDEGVMAMNLLSKASLFPEAFSEISANPKDNANAIAAELSKLIKKPVLSDNELNNISMYTSRLVGLCKKSLCAYANKALAEGCDPKVVARELQKMAQTLFNLTTDKLAEIKGLLSSGGALNSTANLAKAQDPNAYQNIKEDDPQKAMLDQIKQAFPWNNAMEHAQILAYCTTHNLQVEEYAKYAQFIGTTLKASCFSMTGAFESRVPPMKLHAAAQTLQEALKKCCDGMVPKDPAVLNKILNAAAHAAMLEPGKDKYNADKFKNLRDISNYCGLRAKELGDKLHRDINRGKLPNGEERDNQIAFIRELSLLNQASSAYLKAKQEVYLDISQYTLDRYPSNKAMSSINQVSSLIPLEAPRMQQIIREECAKVVPDELISSLAEIVTVLVQSNLSKNNSLDVAADIRRIIQKIATKGDGILIRGLEKPKSNPEHAARLIDRLINDPDDGVKATLKRQKKKIVGNYHNNFDRDIIGNLIVTESIKNFNGLGNDRIALVHRDLEQKVPAKLLPFVSTYLMQGGVIGTLQNFLTMNIPGKVSPGLNKPSQLDLVQQGWNQTGTGTNEISFEGDEMVIKTVYTTHLEIRPNFDGVEVVSGISGKNKFAPQTYTFETRLNLKADPDEDGFPKNGLSLKKIES